MVKDFDDIFIFKDQEYCNKMQVYQIISFIKLSNPFTKLNNHHVVRVLSENSKSFLRKWIILWLCILAIWRLFKQTSLKQNIHYRTTMYSPNLSLIRFWDFSLVKFRQFKLQTRHSLNIIQYLKYINCSKVVLRYIRFIYNKLFWRIL